MRRLYVGTAILLVLILAAFCLRACKDKKIDGQIKSTTLAPKDQTKFIVDPQRHTVVTVTRRPDGSTDTRAVFLPPHGVSITVGKDKSVTVVGRSWGTEVSPFVGFALASDIRARASLGLNLFYVQRWEFGAGLVSSNDIRDARVFVHVSYNPYANYFVSLGIDHKQTAHLMAGLKF